MQEIFGQALELDPDSAEARVGIATALAEKVVLGYSKSREQDIGHADRLLGEALARDRNLPQLHWTLAYVRRMQKRFDEAKIEFENALALDRNFAGAMLQLGNTLIVLGKPETALPYLEKGIKLMPRHQNIHFYYFSLGACHLYLGHLDKAIEFLRQARASGPQVYFIHFYLAATLALHGDIDEAKLALAEFRKLKPELRSLAYLHRSWSNYSSPPFAALWAKTIDVGLLRAGLPAE